ncbi:hypothetical protein U9M48_010937 [Paspalum notatum var. saurae]|uniref:Uncharacterized protein n=1 Tax=Paspalum notatum var. saurae TaxID=547442 RepID=A0AAQ3WGL3_PASNO
MCVMASVGFTNYTAFCLPTGTVAAVENVEAGSETVDLFPQNIGLCFASDEKWPNASLTSGNFFFFARACWFVAVEVRQKLLFVEKG